MAAKSNSKVTLKAKGIYTNYNRLGSVPDGSLLEASNVVIDKEDVIEPRRGFKITGNPMISDSGINSPTYIARQLINYEDKLLRHFQISSTKGYIEYGIYGTGNKNDTLKTLFATTSGMVTDGVNWTFTTQKVHGLAIGDFVTIDGVTTPIGFPDTSQVISVPSPTQITFQDLTGSPPATVATGTPVIIRVRTASIAEPEDGTKIKSVESNSNLYFTSSTGIKKIDSYNGTISDSGVPKALDIEATLYNEDGFFLPGESVGYQLLWGIKDGNDNLILGAPSAPVTITNQTQAELFMADFNALLLALDSDTYPTDNDYSVAGRIILTTDNEAAILQKMVTNAGAPISLVKKLDLDAGIGNTTFFSGLPYPAATTYTELIANFNYITGLLNSDRRFTVTAANATIGTTYTNNSPIQTFTVLATIVAATTLYTSSAGSPTASGTLTKTGAGAGDASITFSSSVRPSVYPVARTSQSVKVTATVPEGITTAHFYQLYRTAQSSALPESPFKLVYEGNPTYSQLFNGTLDIYDNQPDVLREPAAELYTDPNLEGSQQANTQVPFAKDIALYNGMAFYANTKTRHLLEVDLIGIDYLTPAGPNQTTIVFKRGATTLFTAKFDTTENISTCTAKIYTAGLVSANLEDTAKSLAKVINRYSGNADINAYYISGPNDAPGKIVFENISISESPFNVEGGGIFSFMDPGSTEVSMFNPSLIDPETSTNETKPNRIYYSKLQEPEAVPALNYIQVGGGNNTVLRIKELRDGLFIFSKEGIFKIVGYSPQSLSLTLVDNTTTIVAPESLAKGNNLLYAFCDDGIVSVSDGGIEIISRQIEDQILKLQGSGTAFTSKTVGTFYDTDRKYLLFTIKESTDTVATTCHVYNILTNSWVNWDMGKNCALVGSDDRLYLGPTDTNYLEQERKTLTYKDHCDREHTVNILSYSRNMTEIALGETPTSTPTITAIDHGLTTGDLIELVNTNCVPTIDGEERVTVLSKDTFTVSPLDHTTGLPLTITTPGTSGYSGYWTTKETNTISMTLNTTTNVNVGDAIVQTVLHTPPSLISPYYYDAESIITSIDRSTKVITLSNSNVYRTSDPPDTTVYNKFDISVKWMPVHAGDPSIDKQFREAHVMFDKYRGYGVQLEFSNDSKRSEALVSLNNQVISNYGRGRFGSGNWGGETGSNNMRCYVPQDKQRCRLLGVKFSTAVAREQWRLEGIALFLRFISERTNLD